MKRFELDAVGLHTPNRIVWAGAGSPKIDAPRIHRPEGATCACCGALITEGVSYKLMMGPTFSDHDNIAAVWSDVMCDGCGYCLQGNGRNTLRMWSILWAEGWPAPPSNDKVGVNTDGSPTRFAPLLEGCPNIWIGARDRADLIAGFLVDPPQGPWFCSISTSSQKHTVPFAVVNHGAGPWQVRFESVNVRSSPGEFARVLLASAMLYEAGFIREDIETLDPHPGKILKHGEAVWRTCSTVLRPFKGSHLAELAIFLLTKEYAHGYIDLCKRRLAPHRPLTLPPARPCRDVAAAPIFDQPGAGGDLRGADPGAPGQRVGGHHRGEELVAPGSGGPGVRVRERGGLRRPGGRHEQEAPDRGADGPLGQQDLFAWLAGG